MFLKQPVFRAYTHAIRAFLDQRLRTMQMYRRLDSSTRSAPCATKESDFSNCITPAVLPFLRSSTRFHSSPVATVDCKMSLWCRNRIERTLFVASLKASARDVNESRTCFSPQVLLALARLLYTGAGR